MRLAVYGAVLVIALGSVLLGLDRLPAPMSPMVDTPAGLAAVPAPALQPPAAQAFAFSPQCDDWRAYCSTGTCRACKSCRSRNGASCSTSGGAGGCARTGGALQCRRLHRCLPFVYSLRLHLPADRRAPAALHEEIDTADELRRFRVRDAWNRRANVGVSLGRLSLRGPGNAVSRLPYHPHGFGQHRAARNPLAHHSAAATEVGRAGVRHAAAPQSRGSECGAQSGLSEESGAGAAGVDPEQCPIQCRSSGYRQHGGEGRNHRRRNTR